MIYLNVTRHFDQVCRPRRRLKTPLRIHSGKYLCLLYFSYSLFLLLQRYWSHIKVNVYQTIFTDRRQRHNYCYSSNNTYSCCYLNYQKRDKRKQSSNKTMYKMLYYVHAKTGRKNSSLGKTRSGERSSCTKNWSAVLANKVF